MRINQEPRGVFLIYNSRPKIDTNPEYQRGPVWSVENKQLLIDTILRGYDIPKLYFREIERPPFENEVVDGQQRLRAIWDFRNGHFALGEVSSDLPGLQNNQGKYFDELPTPAQETFLSYSLTVVYMRECEEVEIREMFLRLQEGKSLNPAEKRNAMMGEMRDFVAELAENHSVFPKTKIRNNRKQWDDIAAHVTCLELAGGPTDIKAANLKKMYEDNVSFDASGPKASKIKKVLNYMSRCLSSDTPEMDIKWGFVDFYLLVSSFLDEYVTTGRHGEFVDRYVGFEMKRRGTDDPVDLLGSGHSYEDRDLYSYIESFQRDGATRRNIEIRHDVYKRWFLGTLTDLEVKDTSRVFTRDQRIIIWRNGSEKCQDCATPITLDEMHADHIAEYEYHHTK